MTAFSVAWGIFMLVVLLGSGQGLSNGVTYQFRDDAVNSLWIYPGETSLPHAGLRPGRRIQLTNADHDDIVQSIEGVEHITSRFRIDGPVTVSRGKENGAFDVRCVHPAHQYLEKTRVIDGRFLNDLDLSEFRKVAVIGKLVKDALFATEPAVGKTLQINGLAFKVVGVFEDDGGEGEMQKIYLPITTSQRAFNGSNRIGQIMMTVGDASLDESQAMADEAQARLATHHRFASDDRRAVRVNNNVVQFNRFITATCRQARADRSGY